jgi:hypothetical protein
VEAGAPLGSAGVVGSARVRLGQGWVKSSKQKLSHLYCPATFLHLPNMPPNKPVFFFLGAAGDGWGRLGTAGDRLGTGWGPKFEAKIKSSLLPRHVVALPQHPPQHPRPTRANAGGAL